MLRSLELFGFKSFADKTVFEFSSGITGVVGPNGSGKSNVVDAIKWILGDQSAKSLRGKDMTDVIFNGSSSRGGAQFAESTLVFDNTTRFLPVDLDEVAVGRRLWKSGDSEYLINRNVARLKDVRDLFVGTGAGAAAYCIIEQGRVDQILQSNAANRRLIFEEAAGVSRFKARKTEAIRRLDRVEQNLLRLTDIVDEVESQVNTVRSQAQRAARYREVSTELEELWIGMVADDFRRQNMVRTLLQQQRDEGSATLAEVRQQQQTTEKQLAEVDAALTAVDDELRQVERSRSDLQSRLASLETTQRHQSARESELRSELVRLQRQQVVMDGRVAEAEAEERHLENVLRLEQTRFEERQAHREAGNRSLRELQAALQAAQQEAESLRRQQTQQAQQNTERASALGGLRSQLESLQKKRHELVDSKDTLSSEIERLRLQTAQHKLAVEQAAQALRATEEYADELLSGRESLLSQRDRSRESLAELRELRSAAIARRNVLDDLEDRQEGFGIGVRDILKRAEEGSHAPWNLIRGTVSDLLDVDMDHAALLEVALSGRAQLLVIDDLNPLVDYLNSGRCRITGRVGFVSLADAELPPQSSGSELHAPDAGNDAPSPQPTKDDLSQIGTWSGGLALGAFDDDWLGAELSDTVAGEFAPELNVMWIDGREDGAVTRSVFTARTSAQNSPVGRPGVIGRADSLARSPKHLPHLAAHLLADTWVVETLADALRLAAELGDDFRFVTLQGELVERDHTLFAGNVRSESAVLSRKSELRRLRNEIHRIEHQIAERDLRLKNLILSLESADGELRGAREDVALQAIELRTCEQHYTDSSRQLDTAERHSKQLSEQLAGLDDDLHAGRIQIQELQQQHETGEQDVRSLQQQIDASESALRTHQQQIASVEKERTDTNLELTRSEERVLGIREAVQRLREDLQQRRLQQQEALRRLTGGRERVQELNLSTLNVRAEMAELLVVDEQLHEQIFRRSEGRNALKRRRQQATQAEQQARELCRRHESEFHELELKIRGIDHQLETAAERIRDEFQVEVTEAVAAGRSAVAVWLREQEAGESRKDQDAEPESASAEPGANGFVEADDAISQEGPLQQVESRQDSTATVDAILRDELQYAEIREAVEQRVDRLRRQLKKIGNVGMESLDNLTELETRFDRLHSQLKDLEAARDTLRDIVRKINSESRRMFLESFECIRGHFRELFRRLFGGGEADVILEDPEDVLECAIDVVARPPGKELRSISLLSGGEKTMTAVALLLSIFRSRPSPFCILDEVDAALDDANISRFVNVLKEFQTETQFIMITHRKPTMAVTDVLYGVTMEESGISKRLSVRFEEIDEHGNFVPRERERSRAA